MTGTFYGVLGVGPDADEDAIRRAYRERVKECHPDVSADPDAREQFKRLTTARETLTDTNERARYDRLGHASYVRCHVESSAWAVDDRSSVRASRNPDSGPDPDSAGTDERDDTDTDGPSATSSTEENAQNDTTNHAGGTTTNRTRDTTTDRTRRSDGNRTRADTGRTATARTGSWQRDPGAGGETAAGGETRAETGTGAKTGTGTGAKTGAGTETGDDGGSEESGQRASAARNTTRARTGQSREEGGGSGSSRSRSGPYARTSFWHAETVGVGNAGSSSGTTPRWRRVVSGLRALGPWVLVHIVFLSLAAGTSWYVYTEIITDPASSLPLLFVLVGEVCLAVILSTIHVLSEIYR